MKLRKIQQELQGFLLESRQDIIPRIVETPQMSIEVRLGIYGNAYYQRLWECLAENYPALHTLLGDTEFEKLAVSYIDRYPSQHFSVRYFGHELASFLASHPHYGQQGILAEMAQWEWALRFAFDAPDLEPISYQALEQIPLAQWPGLRFQLHPSCRLLYHDCNTVALWQRIQDQGEPLAPEQLEEKQCWIIWRRDLNTLFQSLNQETQDFLQALQEGENFQRICEHMAGLYQNQGAMMAAGSLRKLVEDGIIGSVSQGA